MQIGIPDQYLTNILNYNTKIPLIYANDIPDVRPNPRRYPSRSCVFFPLSGVAIRANIRPAPIMAPRKPAWNLVNISTYTPTDAAAQVIVSVP